MKTPNTMAAVAAGILASAASANPIDQIRPDAPELADYGLLPVGVQTLSMVNPNQIDVISINGDEVPDFDGERAAMNAAPTQRFCVTGRRR